MATTKNRSKSRSVHPAVGRRTNRSASVKNSDQSSKGPDASDRRYQIFVSSTFKDLAAQRKKAIDVIWQAGHIPIDMSTFSAAHDDDRQVIQRAIHQSQIYLLILGHRYGQVPSSGTVSYTELEYQMARDAGLHIIALRLNDADIACLRNSLDRSQHADSIELQHEADLDRFQNEVCRDHFDKPWSSRDQFKYVVHKALTDNLPLVKQRGLVWEQSGPARVIQSASKNEFIVKIVEELTSFKKLSERCLVEAEAKQAAAAFLREVYLDRVIAHRVSLFFESGSTVAYVAREWAPELKKHVQMAPEGEPSIDIKTNNILVYLQLWLQERIPCTTFPWSPPTEETYGASYGGLEHIQSHAARYDLLSLDSAVRDEIERLKRMQLRLMQLPSSPALLVGAAAGVQFRAD